MDAWHGRGVWFTQGSTIRVGSNTYSVPSRLIGEQVDVHVMAECLEVWHGGVQSKGSSARGHNKHVINYRHVIDWLCASRGRSRPIGTGTRCSQPAGFAEPTTSCWHKARPAHQGLFPDPGVGGEGVGSRGRRRPGPALGRTCRSPRPSSRSTWVTTWACLRRWRWSSRRWICRCTTCYSRPGRIFHQ